MNTLSQGAANTYSSYTGSLLNQQQIQGDHARVQKDLAQLRQDRARLDSHLSQFAAAQQQSNRIQQSVVAQGQQAGLDHIAKNAQLAVQQAQPVSASTATTATVAAPQATVNTRGQTVGTVINVVA